MTEDLTVVVVALLGGQALEECIDAVRAQCANVLAVQRDGTITDAEGRTVGMAGQSDIPAKRRSGVELAATPLIALLEDTVVPVRGWADAMTSALGQKDAVACGGPVRVAEGLPAQTQALTLSEYGRYNDRRGAGAVSALPGCNFAFRRDALLKAMQGHGLVDLPVFARLAENGGKLVWAPNMAVTFAHPFPVGARLKTRFDHGRIYGSSQTRRASTAAKALLLPAVLTARTLRQSGPISVSTLGWLALQHTAWAAGEFTGALVGRGPSQWR
jgi:hypothetical protein